MKSAIRQRRDRANFGLLLLTVFGLRPRLPAGSMANTARFRNRSRAGDSGRGKAPRKAATAGSLCVNEPTCWQTSLDAIGKDISQIETDELLLDKHRKKMEEIERLKARLAERQLTAPRGPFV